VEEAGKARPKMFGNIVRRLREKPVYYIECIAAIEETKMDTRRSFVHEIAVLSALAAIAREAEAQQPAAKKTQEFWDAYFNEAERADNNHDKGAEAATHLDEKKIANFLQATDHGLRFSSDIGPNELLAPPPPETDVVLTVTPGRFRPSTDDHTRIQQARGSQVRLDWFQRRPLINLVAPMAWAGLAAWSPQKKDPKTGKVTGAAPIPPTLANLNFRDPNAPDAPPNNQVILMGGSGKMAVNVSAVRLNDKVDAAIKYTVDYSSIVAPYFGFAPLAIPALRAFTQLIGYLYHRESILLNSVPISVVATQEAASNDGSPAKVKMISGHYVAVPGDHVDRLKDFMPKLRVDDSGWLVHQDADKNTKPEDRAADKRVPDATYLTMNVKVSSLSEAVKEKGKG
jgi:hypothetical protein